MALLVLVRHGESTANLANVFTGWLDVALSPTGDAEARTIAEKLRGQPGPLFRCATSTPSRNGCTATCKA